jgi:hypothetical protein
MLWKGKGIVSPDLPPRCHLSRRSFLAAAAGYGASRLARAARAAGSHLRRDLARKERHPLDARQRHVGYYLPETMGPGALFWTTTTMAGWIFIW